MEHILISPGKLKLMLTKSDLDKYELDDVTLYSEDRITRRAFRELLADVKKDVGFDTAEDKVLIQLYPSKDGGAEIYITRLAVRGEREECDKLSVVYTFPTMDELLLGCQRLYRSKRCKKSSAWQGEGRYYLITEEEGIRRSPLREAFAKSGCEHPLERLFCSAELGEAYVLEHCECFFPEKAVEKLASLA